MALVWFDSNRPSSPKTSRQNPRRYVMVYGMKRTTVFLPEDLKTELAAAAVAEGCSEAELIREGVRLVVTRRNGEGPRIPLFTSGDPTLAERVDELLEGFGES